MQLRSGNRRTSAQDLTLLLIQATLTCCATVEGAVVVAVAERMLEYTLDVVKLEPGDTKDAQLKQLWQQQRKENEKVGKCFPTVTKEWNKLS